MEYTKEKVRETLEKMAEPEYAVFAASLLGREAKVLGVRLPKLRELAKKIAKADGLQYLEETLCDSGRKTETPSEEVRYMEEIMLYGMVIGCMKEKLEVLFPYIKRYVEEIDNWSLCDSFCSSLKQTKKEPERMWEFLQPYLRSDEEFELRFGIVMLMDYYVMPQYIDRLLEIFDSIYHEGYYVKMAVAWALSVCLVKEWDKSLAYMESTENHLDDFTYKKAVQKSLESFRLTKEQKDRLRELRFRKKGNDLCTVK